MQLYKCEDLLDDPEESHISAPESEAWQSVEPHFHHTWVNFSREANKWFLDGWKKVFLFCYFAGSMKSHEKNKSINERNQA